MNSRHTQFLCGLATAAVSQLAFGGEMGSPGAREHVSWSGETSTARSNFSSPAESIGSANAEIAPTRATFMAQWSPVIGAAGYRLDVSTSSGFEHLVTGYDGLDVGPATARMVTGLAPGTTYYYRVTSYGALNALTGSGETKTATTASGAGLVINPTFDSSVINSPSSGAIQAMVGRAIAIYEAMFSDPVTVFILYRHSTTQPNGAPIGNPDQIAQSNYVVYTPPWNVYIDALRADAKTANDATANASLPPTPLSPSIVAASANGRALAGDTPPAMFADGSVATGGPYDGIVTLNATSPYSFSRPPSSTAYDAQTSVEHEMDEILGLGSYLNGTGTNVRPQDLFSWSSPGVRNRTKSGRRYFSIDSGNTPIVDFSQVTGYDYGDWQSDPCPQAVPYVQNAFGCHGQAMDISKSSPEGVNLDVIGFDPVARGQLLNISTRMEVLQNDRVLIAGFIVTGTSPKKIIVRGMGPSLPAPGPLADPVLELHQGNTTLATNDNWRVNDQTGQSQESEIEATTIPPSKDLESALVATLNPGSYTAILAGKNGGTGIGLVEVYDLDQGASSRLANISSRGFVETADNVMIGGFIVGGPTGENGEVLVRALGPSLTGAGVADPLNDPTLELHNQNGGTIATNDNWKFRADGTSQQSEIESTTIAPGNDLESALLRTLAPGNYTAIVRGKNNGTGVGLVEIYNLQ